MKSDPWRQGSENRQQRSCCGGVRCKLGQENDNSRHRQDNGPRGQSSEVMGLASEKLGDAVGSYASCQAKSAAK